MYTLYTRPGSGGFVVEAALAMADAPFRQIDVPKKDPPDPAFLAVSPLNQVPALTLPDGCSLTESAAICILLAERHPQAGLAPEAGSPGRADFLRWMAFMSSVLYPAILRLYYAHRCTASADGVQAVKEAAIAEMDRGFAIVDNALAGRNWLAGEELSLADIYLVMLAAWHPDTERARMAWPNIERLWGKLRQHELMRKLNAAHDMWPQE
ncbi:glutathione S-transferase family protein [Mesorhizobium sp.]|uniref:glutathione S-transferase family protein n=1 Tax=Mesorhizobium sp. TaxID=1871066 RepID=UPI000FE3A58E|nr:glutathione S-transferase family protein [Mesorhizobium sp.]RWA64717.1 MAG: glutathione S-transferase family protein [Mesorhizobium sp.]RWB95692.1 MAG: glutathione S-transferase family protein [Mesorhizobium sp.]RWG77963.1 MAG: glutathione S-transferase family protein [Mesorhizobium sp.]RWG82420.1 MAG: glutathione S-transferase family protein [Mesorhizobium sp.]RWK01957.1 MAG: glutathione S-transferase family protein [Mesorhizobium sp.]